MNHVTMLLAVALATTPSAAMAQHLNWRALDGQHRHAFAAAVGMDPVSYYSLSYEYHLPRAVIPLAFAADVRAPFGDHVLDDWQVGFGARAEPWRSGVLSLGLGAGLRIRRYETTLARLYNGGFGANVSFGATGPRWSAVAIATHESSSLTHIEHKLLKEYYPEVRDGWYDADGGIYRFGVSTGVAVWSWGATLTAGRMFGQDFRNNPGIPYFAEVVLRKGL
jgi:hypothetical protein